MGAHTQKQALLVIEFDFEVLHGPIQGLQFCNQVVPLECKLFLCDRHVAHLLFLVNQLVPCGVELLLAFVDFTHVGACLELVLLCQLPLIFAETLDFLVESLNLELSLR